MQNTILAQRYAKALFELSLELKKLEEVRKDMGMLLETIAGSKEFKRFLVSPVIQAEKKVTILHTLFSGRMADVTLKFMVLLAKNRRESDLKIIAEEFIEQYKTYNNITTVKLQTAVKIGAGLRDEILERLAKRTGGSIDLVEQLDDKLIGGFIVTIGNDQYDASLLRVFNQLKKEFDENPYVREI
jgi:F-type H+-transporting ATPase subunit delta